MRLREGFCVLCCSAPSVRFAGPRVFVFKGSSAKPQACGSPSEGTAEW